MPGRKLSETEKKLLKRWDSTFGPSLRTVEIGGAPLRGVASAKIDFRYPLTVIAGKNGVGKSTVLACAACAYQQRGNFASYFLDKPYFNFPQFFFAGCGDSPLQNVEVSWTCRDERGQIAITKVKKEATRWLGYKKRLDRPVEFVGTIRGLHPGELRVLRRHFDTSSGKVPKSLGDGPRKAVSRILSRVYQDVQHSVSGRSDQYDLHHLKSSDGTGYSAFNAGSGEDIACCISRVIQDLPKGSLLVIEEIETGLHPAAQRNLVGHLLELCETQRLQVICSSHSASVLEAVPSEARVLLIRNGARLDPRYEVTVAEAVSDLSEMPAVEMAVYVEDEVARSLVQEALPAATRARVRIIPCGSWDDVVRFLAGYYRDPALGRAIGILDGDRNGKDTEHQESFKRYYNGILGDQEKEWLGERLMYLPGTAPPEKWLWQLGQETVFQTALGQGVNASSEVLGAFFSAPTPDNHHGIPYLFSQRIGTDEGRALVALAVAAVKAKRDSFSEIVARIAAHLDMGA